MPFADARRIHLLVTGANGFVGSKVTAQALAQGYSVTAVVRSGRSVPSHPLLRTFVMPDIGEQPDWEPALTGIDVVIHTAARAHIMQDRSTNPLEEFRRVNALGTRRLAEAAARRGVRRLIFVSSIKVNGEATSGVPFRGTDPARPVDPYGVSKWEGEQALAEVATRTGLETCVVRPPLVYGPGVRANFLRLLRWVDRGLPLPFGSIDNRRSLVGVANLSDLLLQCATADLAAGKVYLAADGGVAPSTGALVRLLASALGKRATLLPVPPTLLKQLGSAVRRGEQVRRLCDSLEVDSSPACDDLGWTPPESLEQGVRQTALWYRASAVRSGVPR